MTDKELSKLRRSELLELLLVQSRNYAALESRLAQAEERLQSRQLTIDQAGTMADAAFQLNDVIGAAQKAIDLYTENVNRRCAQQEEAAAQTLSQAQAAAAKTAADADAQARKLLADAQAQAAKLQSEAQAKSGRLLADAEVQSAQLLADARAQAGEILSQASHQAAQTRADAQREKEAMLDNALGSARIIVENARVQAGEPEELPVQQPPKRRSFLRRS